MVKKFWEVMAVFKRFVAVGWTVLICLTAAVSYVHAQNKIDCTALNNCRRIFAYSGNSSAYFFGYSNSTLYSARALPDYQLRYVSVSGTIYAVTHDERFAYALYDVSRLGDYRLMKMNMQNGNCSDIALLSDININIMYKSFAVAGDEIILLYQSDNYSYAMSMDSLGKQLFIYSLPSGIRQLFNNGRHAYAVTNIGEIYRLSEGTTRYCAAIGVNEKFQDAGVGYIFTDSNVLVSLTDGSRIQYDKKFAVKTATQFFQKNDVLLFAAVENKTAALSGDYFCEINDYSQHQNTTASQNDTSTKKPIGNSHSNLTISEGCIVGLPADTTVSRLKSVYPQITAVYDDSGSLVTSGKLRTGYSAQTGSGVYELAVRGDISPSGTVNSRDVKALMTYLTDSDTLTGCRLKAADLNADNAVNTQDLVLLARECE